MLIKTTNKMDCIRAFINTWIKDKSRYCNNCGFPYFPNMTEPCCTDMQFGNNMQIVEALILQNKDRKMMQFNDFGASKGKTFRNAISLPPKLLKDLETYFKENYNEKLFENNTELHKFMKEFPMFTIARRI